MGYMTISFIDYCFSFAHDFFNRLFYSLWQNRFFRKQQETGGETCRNSSWMRCRACDNNLFGILLVVEQGQTRPHASSHRLTKERMIFSASLLLCIILSMLPMLSNIRKGHIMLPMNVCISLWCIVCGIKINYVLVVQIYINILWENMNLV